MAGPDKFDPTRMLDTAKNMMNGPHDAPSGEGTDRVIAEKFDGASTSAQNVVFGEDARPLSSDGGYGGPPAGVDTFRSGL